MNLLLLIPLEALEIYLIDDSAECMHFAVSQACGGKKTDEAVALHKSAV